MTKLNKKLSISICIAVILVSVVSFNINKLFVHKYYLYEKKKIINNAGKEIEKIDIDNALNSIEDIENKYNITIVQSKLNLNYQNAEEKINENLNNEFYKKGINLKKFWIYKDDLSKLSVNSVNKIYNQGKNKYSLLVKFLQKDSYVFGVATTIEHSQETIQIINKFNIIMSGFSVVLITILTFILSNKIIKPIKKIKTLSEDISKLNFRTEEIKTNDEIEDLAQSINSMSISLEKAHNELNDKNNNLKRFISDASHEMKTPIALIKAYSMGIKDKMDDGTFLDTIIEESENLNNIVNTLLYWAKYEKREFNIDEFDLKNKLINIVDSYHILMKENNIDFSLKIDDGDFYIRADEDAIEIVLKNLLSNAIKYTDNNKVEVFLLKNEEIFLSIKNGASNINKDEIDNLFKPFYVLEKSRNKELSGTGLGLSIVKEILDAHNFKYGIDLNDNQIKFFVVINIPIQSKDFD